MGENSRVGAGSVVLSDVPPNSTVVGVPAHIVYRNGERVLITDPHDIKDPLSDALIALSARVEELEERLGARALPARALCRRRGRAHRLPRGTGADARLRHHGRRHLRASAAHCKPRCNLIFLGTGQVNVAVASRTCFLCQSPLQRICSGFMATSLSFTKFVWKNLRRRRLRTLLTLGGISMAVGAFVGLVGFSRSFEQQWMQIYSSSRTDIAVIRGTFLNTSLDESVTGKLKAFPLWRRPRPRSSTRWT